MQRIERFVEQTAFPTAHVFPHEPVDLLSVTKCNETDSRVNRKLRSEIRYLILSIKIVMGYARMQARLMLVISHFTHRYIKFTHSQLRVLGKADLSLSLSTKMGDPSLIDIWSLRRDE